MTRALQGFVAALAVTVLAASAGAQDRPPSGAKDADAPTNLSGVTVTGKRADPVATFVAQVSAANTSKRIARWDRTICSGVVGMPAKSAQYLNDRLARYAAAVGLEPGKPGCKANILVIVAKDAPAFTADMVRRNPNLFTAEGDPYVSASTRGRKAQKDFVETARPVRWWHVSQLFSVDGMPIADDPTGVTIPKSVLVHSSGRIRENVREDLAYVVIIIDAKTAQGVTFQGLCDYVSMVALAQIDPTTDTTAAPSILSLFRDRDAGVLPPTALTEWDIAYLKGLYASAPNMTDPDARTREITREMRRGAKQPAEGPRKPG